MTADSSTDETKQRILEAALTLFGEVGYTRATTRAIAERAGVNEVTLFRHFGNKQGLLLACINAGNQSGFAQTFRKHLTGDYADDILVMARLQMADTHQNFEILRLLLCDAQAVPDLQEMLAMGAEGNLSHIAAYFEEQIVAGIIRPGLDPIVLANAFDSLFSSYILFTRLMGSDTLAVLPPDDVVRSLASVFVQGTITKHGG
ncbi:MAG: TetR/AcrR family transcriptional regulator [Anaerolineaceae bacterium]|nr:TetR/AcrR family transcriptional regulator [Anaerolineaceae bacterium]